MADGAVKSRYGAALRRWREARGLMQADCAERAGVTQQTWSDYETGRRTPSLAALARLHRATRGAVDPMLAVRAAC